jgi:hypothetical protein
MAEITLLSSEEIHPEFGYFWPSARIRRRIRLAILAAGSAGVLAAGGQFSLMARQNLDALSEMGLARIEALNDADLARVENVTLSDRSEAIVANSYAAVILPNYKRKRRATEAHPLAFVPIGRRATETAEIMANEIAAPAQNEAAANGESRRVRTVTVHDGRRHHSPQVFVVPAE